MKRIVRLHVDHLRLDRSAAGMTTDLRADLTEALRQALAARHHGDSPDRPATTRPALRRAAQHLAAQVPLPGNGGDT